MKTILSLAFSNIVALRQEVTINLLQISVEEDNIHFQCQQPVPNIHIIVASITAIYRLKARNAQILHFLDQIDN